MSGFAPPKQQQPTSSRKPLICEKCGEPSELLRQCTGGEWLCAFCLHEGADTCDWCKARKSWYGKG